MPSQRRRDDGPRELPLVALRETVIFPEMIVPLQVGREKSVNALNAAVAEGGPIALVTQRQAEQEDIDDPSELYAVGTLAKIAQVVQLQDGTVRAIVQGQRACGSTASPRRSRTCGPRSRSSPTSTPDGPRGPGADAHRPGPDRAVRRQRRAGPAGGGRRRAQHHRAGPAGRHGRVQPGHDAPSSARSCSRRSTSSSASSSSPTSSRTRSRSSS